MSAFISKIRRIEKALGINSYHVEVIHSFNESEEEALERHIKNNPEDAGKEYIFTKKWCYAGKYVDSHAEFIDLLWEAQEKKKNTEERP